MRILVIGAGPAGLFATHAAVQLGHDVTVVSKHQKSHLYGAQYLHAEVPGLTIPETFEVHYVLCGEVEEYAAKVYGETPPDFVSPQRLVGTHKGWDIRSAYNQAWDLYGSTATRMSIAGPDGLRSLLDLVGADITISTMPANLLCYQPQSHYFTARDAWAIGDAPDRGIQAPRMVERNSVVCNGERDSGWYRASNILGYNTVEWPDERRPPIEGVAKITKPVRTNCDCWADTGRVWRAGRYGTWQKGYLSHFAYWEIKGALEKL